MKYIRTKDKIYDNSLFLREYTGWYFHEKSKVYIFTESEIIKQADTIEELCDEFVAIDICLFGDKTKSYKTIKEAKEDKTFLYDRFYGAIWTDKGLIYVAKMNDKGELELL